MKQGNLSILQTYTIVNSFYTGTENGMCCQNCGRYITNVAVLKGNNDNVTYHVGMDCAETISKIENSFDFEYVHKVNFNVAKQIYTKARKLIKDIENANLTPTVYYGETELTKGIDISSKPFQAKYRWWKYVNKDVYIKYVEPMLKSVLENVEVNTGDK